MPIMIEMPVTSANVPRLDAVLVTHSDNDHYSVPTCRDLAGVTDAYHSTHYVASLMTDEGLPAHGHAIGDDFTVGAVRVEVTPADHAWQNATPGASTRIFQPEDACGFWINNTRRHHLGARRLTPDTRASPADARPRCAAIRLLRQRMALRARRRRADGERLSRHAAAAPPLGIGRRTRLPALQRRPANPAQTEQTRSASTSWPQANPSHCGLSRKPGRASPKRPRTRTLASQRPRAPRR